MQHLEPVEPRRLFTNTGLDVHFGKSGVVALGNTYNASAILPTADGVFVDVSGLANDTARTIYKFAAGGKLDTAWGKDGRIGVNAALTDQRLSRRTQLAYDAKTHSLYVAGQDADAPGSSVNVVRYDADGARDRTFGHNGVATYVVPNTAADSDTTVGLTFDAIGLSASGKLYLAFNQTSLTGYYGPTKSTDDLSLWRLNADGTPDTSYGTAGLATIATGGSTGTIGEHSDYNRASVPVFEDWQLRPDDTVRVISLRQNAITSGTDSATVSGNALSQTQYVQSDIVSGVGRVRTDKARTWTLVHDAYKVTNALGRSFQPVLVTADGTAGVQVVGARATVPTAIAGNTLSVIKFDDAGRSTPASLGLRDGGTLYGLARGTDGTTVFFHGTSATKFDADLALDRTFGHSGSVTTDRFIQAAAVDTDGRVLALDPLVDGTELLRFDGK